ncbi:adipose-secreted signaling protein isoform X2 [Narcine bancroftii]|uniref:adipose-secreted signaling protein isoform X2 n=1 Tax=Narcine bancroftii TaxID=1343680 RepID=UPI003832179D
MASAWKGTKHKAGGIRFRPESHEGAANHVHFEEKLHDSVVMVTQEEDGSFLVKVGFLKISHKYEITFLLPAAHSLGQGPCSIPLPSPYLKVIEIAPVPEVCLTHYSQEGGTGGSRSGRPGWEKFLPAGRGGGRTTFCNQVTE